MVDVIDIIDLANKAVECWSVEDTVHGAWFADNEIKQVEVWVDASNIAIRACFMFNNRIAEEASWLRAEKIGAHINAPEPEASISV